MIGPWATERLDSGRLDSGPLDAWILDAWTLNNWILGHLDSERLDSEQLDVWILDAWTVDPWTQKILSIFSDISFFLVTIYSGILQYFECSMTKCVMALLKLL